MVSYNDLFYFLLENMPGRFEAQELFQYITGISASRLVIVGGEKADEEFFGNAEKLVSRRKSGEPLQYIIGSWEFYSLPFYVGEGVLIPRQDTEILVDKVLEFAAKKPSAKVLELCAGSGCIGISIDKNSDAKVTCVELSKKAFAYLEKNILLNNSSVKAVLADITKYLPSEGADIIVSNPPYIKTADIVDLQKEVQHEPEMALNGGESGLEFYRTIASRYYDVLNPGGRICFEVGEDQHQEVEEILLKSGYKNTTKSKDLSGIYRVVCGEK